MPLTQVRAGLLDPVVVGFELVQQTIAGRAQEAPHLPGLMAMIDGKPPLLSRQVAADRTTTVLLHQHRVVVVQRDPVASPEMAAPHRLLPAWRVCDLLAVIRASANLLVRSLHQHRPTRLAVIVPTVPLRAVSVELVERLLLLALRAYLHAHILLQESDTASLLRPSEDVSKALVDGDRGRGRQGQRQDQDARAGSRSR